MQITILAASHKEYRMPEDPMYLPLQVGSALNKGTGYRRDDSGDNISIKNPNYCELTGLYWAWKNLKSDYLGLCHYRRYFRGKGKGSKWDQILKREEARELLKIYPMILPVKRNYYVETNYSQYAHAHHAEDLDLTREIISEKYPAYLKAFDDSMKERSGHRFNMFIMKESLFRSYAEWLFDILFELEKRLDITNYSAYDRRVFGFVSERLLDVWVYTNDIDYKELPVINMENQHWFRKIFSFVMRKLKGSRR